MNFMNHKQLVMRNWLRKLLFAVCLAMPLAGCSREPDTVSLSATTFNFSQESLVKVLVNGKSAGWGIDNAKLGEVKGGGKVFCCVSISPTAKSVPVLVEVASEHDYSANARVRLPWSPSANYLAVYVLPDHKVVVAVVPSIVEDPPSLKELLQVWEALK